MKNSQAFRNRAALNTPNLEHKRSSIIVNFKLKTKAPNKSYAHEAVALIFVIN